MSSVNRVVLIGRLGREPEMRYTMNGTPVTTFSLATDRPKSEETDWHTIVTWNKLAEICAEYLKKGMLVCVQGRLQYAQYENKDAVKVVRARVVADEVTFLENKANNNKKEDLEELKETDDGWTD